MPARRYRCRPNARVSPRAAVPHRHGRQTWSWPEAGPFLQGARDGVQQFRLAERLLEISGDAAATSLLAQVVVAGSGDEDDGKAEPPPLRGEEFEAARTRQVLIEDEKRGALAAVAA